MQALVVHRASCFVCGLFLLLLPNNTPKTITAIKRPTEIVLIATNNLDELLYVIKNKKDKIRSALKIQKSPKKTKNDPKLYKKALK
jgi:hypothetical protein